MGYNAGYNALQRYKMRGLYRRNRKLSSRVRNVNKFRNKLLTTEGYTQSGVPDSKRMALFGANWEAANEDQKLARRAMNFRGEGDYKQWINSWLPRGTFSNVGRGLGAWSGIPGLDNLGAWAGSKVSDYAGFGDYSANAITTGGSGSQQSISVNKSDMTGDVYVTRTEFVGNLTATLGSAGASPFAIQSFPLNPGISKTFPFLSQLANNFTLYEFSGLMFQYKPLFSEDAGSSNNLGKVIFATQYDPSAPAFQNSVQMENYDYANATKPSSGLVHGVETANHQQFGNLQYIRSGNVSRDLIFTDIGNLWVATEGIPFSAAATQVIGEIWVTYRVKLSRAEVNNSLLGFNIPFDQILGTSSAAQLALTAVPRSISQIGCTISNSASTSFRLNFPPSVSIGSYLVSLQFRSGGTVFGTQRGSSIIGAQNCTVSYPGLTAPTGTIFPDGTVAGTSVTNDLINFIFVVNVNAPGAQTAFATVSVNNGLTATSTWVMFITQINASGSAL